MDPRRFWKQFVGQRFANKYHLIELLGAGSFGGVFQADEVIADRVLRQVAIKLFAVEPDKLDQQLRELQLATTLKHPGLLDCYSPEQGMLDGELYLGLVMELAQGTLETRMKKGGLAIAEVTQIAQTLAVTLVFLQSRKIVHRDLKPANILQVHETVKIGDLGIARLLDLNRTSTSTSPSQQIGSLPYMPPESYSGKIHPAWDVWSLGIMLAELLGNTPFPATNAQELMMQVVMAEPQFQTPLPEAFAWIIQGCLLKDNDQRWTAQQVVDALQGRSKIDRPTRPLEQVILPSPAPIRTVPRSILAPFLREHLDLTVELEMVYVAGGQFWMGSSGNDADAQDCEFSQHSVQVAAFYMGKYPITQAQYRAVMGTSPAKEYDAKFQGDRQPVVGVSWEEAQAFCQKLSQRSGRTYRLPTEAEWEYACRAGSTGKYCFGDDEKQLGNYAWYYRNADGQTHPVGQKRSNAFGLYDMHGNVWEWCEDEWHSNYQGAPVDGSTWVTGKEQNKLLRGGSWFFNAWLCRSAIRGRDLLGTRNNNIGFRVCCSPQYS